MGNPLSKPSKRASESLTDAAASLKSALDNASVTVAGSLNGLSRTITKEMDRVYERIDNGALLLAQHKAWVEQAATSADINVRRALEEFRATLSIWRIWAPYFAVAAYGSTWGLQHLLHFSAALSLGTITLVYMKINDRAMFDAVAWYATLWFVVVLVTAATVIGIQLFVSAMDRRQRAVFLELMLPVPECPTGTVLCYHNPHGAALPAGWLSCNGQTITSVMYPALCLHLNNGVAAPNAVVPDFRGRFLLGADLNGSGLLTMRPRNTTGGAETVTLTAANLPAHTHQYSAPLPISNSSAAWQSGLRDGGGHMQVNWGQTQTTVATGTSTPLDTMPPFATVDYIMKV